MLNLHDDINPRVNVVIRAYERGKLIAVRDSHNVFINGGRAWLARNLGAADYDLDPPTPHVTTKIKWMGLGCGGALQPDNQFSNVQQELVTVNHLEDPVPFSTLVATSTYLKQVHNQNLTPVYFPSDFRTRLIVDIPEGEISFVGSTTRVSNVNVGLSVPVSEVALFLSDALPNFSQPVQAGEADPAASNSMVAYNIFDPLPITPNVVLRIEWELRL